MDNILSIDVEDWFHILNLPTTPPIGEWHRLESRVESNLRRLLDTLESGGVRATCFFLGWIAERLPDLVRAASRRGHEIAAHGYGHEIAYTQTRTGFREDVRRTKDILEQITGAPVLGYRAPGFSIIRENRWALTELVEAGYRYDSSIFPARRGHGGLVGAPVSPFVHRTSSGVLLEFPMSVAEVLGRRICFFGGGYFRLFPYWLIRRMSRSVNDAGRPVIYYLHPREIDPDHPRIRMSVARRFKSYVNLRTTESKLRALLHDQKPITFARWIERHGGSLREAVT